jgi:hypothetical protein
MPQLEASDLRALAEKADGMRERDLHLVVRKGKLEIVDELKDGDRRVAAVRTDDVTKRRRPFSLALELGAPVPEPESVSASETPASGELPAMSVLLPSDMTKVFDALFWTESAVDKFVLPYYQKLYSRKRLAELEDSFDTRPNVAAIAHFGMSETRLVEKGIAPAEAKRIVKLAGRFGFVALVGDDEGRGRVNVLPFR